jgi:hypothetical protein
LDLGDRRNNGDQNARKSSHLECTDEEIELYTEQQEETPENVAALRYRREDMYREPESIKPGN